MTGEGANCSLFLIYIVPTLIDHRIEKWLNEKFQEPEFEDCFLIEVTSSNQKVQVFIDSDTGISFKTCRQLSRFLEEKIESEELLGPKYTLDVSSPGALRPLLFVRQYPKHIGRSLKVTKKDGVEIEGIMTEVADSLIKLEKSTKVKKEIIKEEFEIPFTDIKESIVLLKF